MLARACEIRADMAAAKARTGESAGEHAEASADVPSTGLVETQQGPAAPAMCVAASPRFDPSELTTNNNGEAIPLTWDGCINVENLPMQADVDVEMTGTGDVC